MSFLVLTLHQDEPLYVGDAKLQMVVDEKGRIKVAIEAPKSVIVQRASAQKKAPA